MTDISKIDMDRINGLLEKLESMKYVVETWQEGTEWYRVWSDGWIEQGGKVTSPQNIQTVNLNKPFTKTSYCVLVTNNSKDTANRRWSSAGVISASQIWVMSNMSATQASTTPCTWYACGY